MSSPSVLMFDLGGVLIDTSGFRRVNELLAQPMEFSFLKDTWLASPAVRTFELGIISPDEFADRFVAEWGLTCDPQAFLDEFTSWPNGFYPGVAELLGQLRARYKLVCLSNSNVLHWARFRSLLENFHIPLSSHLLGAVKPDADCFTRALQACDVHASDVVFFDDSAANIASARELGIRGLHVDGFDQVERATRPFIL